LGATWRQTAYWRDSRCVWTRAVACTSQNYTAHYSLGVTLQVAGALDQAIDEYRKSLAIRPDYAEAHGHLGIALQQRGQLDEAIAEYRRALAIMPDYADAHNNLGAALQQTGKLDEAIEHFRQALKANPYLAEVHGNLAKALLDCGRTDEAAAELQMALRIKPDFERAHYFLALALSRQGKPAEAIFQLQQAMQLKPDNLDVLNQLAWLLATCPDAALRNGPAAVELAQRAAALTAGRQPAVLDTLAAAYAEAGRFLDAVAAAEQALLLASDHGNAALADALRSRIKLYQSGVPYHEPPPARH
jgi:protein O-mannosyl-transferase